MKTMLEGLEFSVVSPHDIDLEAGLELDRSPEEFSEIELAAMMDRDLKAILDCDAVFAFDMETPSVGRSVEIAYAKFIRKPVFTQLADLIAWRAEREAMAA